MTSIKDQILAEIDQDLSVLSFGKPLASSDIEKGHYRGAMNALEHLKKFIDSLPEQPVEKTSYETQKYTPSPSVSIEDVARVQFASHAKVFDKKRKAVFDWEQFKEVVGIFYGFGKKYSTEPKEKEQPEEGLEEEIDACWQNWLSPSNQKEVEGVLPKTEFAMYARHFAEWGAEHLKK